MNKLSFNIGKVSIENPFILAPLAGYTDLPFRTLAKKHGAALIYTEFINAVDILNNNPYVAVRLEFEPSERPIVIQIYDNDPDRIIKTALKVREKDPDIIDINIHRPGGHSSGWPLIEPSLPVFDHDFHGPKRNGIRRKTEVGGDIRCK